MSERDQFIQRFFGQGEQEAGDQPTEDEEHVPDQSSEREFFASFLGGKAEQEARRTRAALGLPQPEEDE